MKEGKFFPPLLESKMSFPYPFPGPVALYNNLPINAQYYKPSQFYITAISLGSITTITTAKDNNYVIGQLCRLIIPAANKCYQLNEQTGYVIDIPASNQVTLDINSIGYNLFQTSTYPVQPQILAIGDINSGAINQNGNRQTLTFIPGSFQDISPL